MRGQKVGRFGWADEMQGGVVFAASFVLGLVTGLFLKDAGKRMYGRTRGALGASPAAVVTARPEELKK